MNTELINNLAKEFNVNPAQLESARNVIEAAIQNGRQLGVTADQQVSLAHLAASKADCAMLLALAEVNAPLNDFDFNMATPAHLIVIKAVAYPDEGIKFIKLLNRFGVHFHHHHEKRVWPAVKVLRPMQDEQNDEWGWPTFGMEWGGWKAANAKQSLSERISRPILFWEFLKHRHSLNKVRRLVESLS